MCIRDREKEDTRFADSVREKSEASGSIVGNSDVYKRQGYLYVIKPKQVRLFF